MLDYLQMKKLLGILVLSLILCNFSYAKIETIDKKFNPQNERSVFDGKFLKKALTQY